MGRQRNSGSLSPNDSPSNKQDDIEDPEKKDNNKQDDQASDPSKSKDVSPSSSLMNNTQELFGSLEEASSQCERSVDLSKITNNCELSQTEEDNSDTKDQNDDLVNFGAENDLLPQTCHSKCKFMDGSKSEDVNTKFIQCCLCTVWYHIDCVGISAKELKKIGFWPCLECRLISKNLHYLRTAISKITNMLSDLCRPNADYHLQNDDQYRETSERTNTLELLAAKTKECERLKSLNENLKQKLSSENISMTSESLEAKDFEVDDLLYRTSECTDKPEVAIAEGHLLIGDSLIRSVDPTADDIRVSCMKGAKFVDISKKLRMTKNRFKQITIVCGTNDISTKTDIERITSNAKDMIEIAMAKADNVTISSIPPRLDEAVSSLRLNRMNERLSVLTDTTAATFVNNDLNFKHMNEIPDESLLLADGIHLSAVGVQRLLQNLKLHDCTACNLTPETNKLGCSQQDSSTSTSKKRKKCTQSRNGVTLFFGKDSIFSNLYMEAPIHVDGVMYNCNEQLYTCTMAKYFGDQDIVKEAMATSDPYRLVELQKKVKNFNRISWLPEAKRTLYLANMAKYTQNATARNSLLNTKGNIIGEASYSRTWGIGAPLHDPRSFSPNWSGENIMGNILMDIRKSLLCEKKESRTQISKKQLVEKSCWFCGEQNHISRNCKYGQEIQCRSCFNYGHKEKFCYHY